MHVMIAFLMRQALGDAPKLASLVVLRQPMVEVHSQAEADTLEEDLARVLHPVAQRG